MDYLNEVTFSNNESQFNQWSYCNGVCPSTSLIKIEGLDQSGTLKRPNFDNLFWEQGKGK